MDVKSSMIIYKYNLMYVLQEKENKNKVTLLSAFLLRFYLLVSYFL